MNIKEMIEEFQKEGLEYDDALARACQDIMLSLIDKANFTEFVTIKGGVVMMNLSKNIRRVTRDLDLDFIKYSISDESIYNFINKLNKASNEIKIRISQDIKSLKHQDYNGKRVNVILINNNEEYYFKLDIGVNANLELEQEVLYFNLNSSLNGVSLLANSKEQIVVEKLKSLLRHGIRSTRYKDVYDIYYLSIIKTLNNIKLKEQMIEYILDDESLRINSLFDITNNLYNLFNNKNFSDRMNNKRDNWLELPTNKVKKEILGYFYKIINDK